MPLSASHCSRVELACDDVGRLGVADQTEFVGMVMHLAVLDDGVRDPGDQGIGEDGNHLVQKVGQVR